MRLIINYPILVGLIAARISSHPAFVGATKLRGNNQDAAAPAPRRLQKQKPAFPLKCASTSIVEVQYADRSIDESYLACETSDGKSFKVTGVPASVVKANKKSVIDGTSELDLPDGLMVDEKTGTINLPRGQALKFKEKSKNGGGNGNGGGKGNGGGNKENKSIFDRSRHLAVTGTRSILVVRVLAAGGAQTTASELRLSDSVFGNGVDGNVDSVTLRSQYKACSHDQLNFEEADDRDGKIINIRNGATTVTVANPTSDGDSLMMNAITAALTDQFGSIQSLADHVMYCLPPGTMNGIAYAYVGGQISVYSDNWCTYLSAQMHEVGHNLGLGHSNESGSDKGKDQSGMMGYSYPFYNGPTMCFNAAKSWQLGWYSDRQQIFNADDGIWSGRLIGQVDRDNVDANTNDKVLLKLNTGTSTDYYAMFNLREGTNSGTVEGGNQVLITSAGGDGNSYAESELVAKLSANGKYIIPDFDGSGFDLKLVVNAVNTNANPAYANVTVSTVCSSNADCDDGLECNGEETCDVGTGSCVPGIPCKEPTSSPIGLTNNPTNAATPNPTANPSKEPTSSPINPTDNPTNAATPNPTNAATPNPTNKPTGSPSNEPTSSPIGLTNNPTNAATPNPTNAATPNPTNAVTPNPTNAVTPNPTNAATPNPTNAVTPNPTNAATPKPTNDVTPNPTNAETPNPTNAATPNPTNAATPNPTNAATPNPTNAATPNPTNAATPNPTNAVTPNPTNAATPNPTNAGTPKPTNDVTPNPTNPTGSPSKKPTSSLSCENDSTWRYTRNGEKKSCNWVAKKQTKWRCKKIGDDGTSANDSCPAACNEECA